MLLKEVIKTDSNEKQFLLSLFSIEKYYHQFTIKKRNGKERNILCPYIQLEKIQLNILNDLLYDKRVSLFAKAYIKKGNLVDNTIIHRGYKYILKLDIHNFFENISYVAIFNIYKEYGFSDALCGLLAHLTAYNDYLPQGAPTSPYLSNLVLRNFDYKVGKWCEEHNINYTRYSDDMTFSMNEYNKELIRFIRVNLYKHGLELNNRPVRLKKTSFFHSCM